jgi:GSCFA family
MKSPYSDLPSERFWRSGVSETDPLTVENLYKKKFAIGPEDKIATAGSCFAQHVSNHLKKNGFSVMDAEPPPAILSDQVARNFGYKIYSARYGNIYTVRQLLQLARDAENGTVDERDVWEKDGRYFDALRPNIEPDGFGSVAETLALRREHLAKVKELLAKMDVFIFTLGLTEAWVDKRTGRVFPTAPGTIAGSYDPKVHEFKNFTYSEIYSDFVEFRQILRRSHRNFKVILTVSPVPLTATASDEHVLLATTYSKSVLRAVAGALSKKFARIDYFPSYEIIVSPWSKGRFYEPNLRSVEPAGVEAVMRVFFSEHSASNPAEEQRQWKSRKHGRSAARDFGSADEKKKARKEVQQSAEDAICEDLLLEAFAPKK